MFVFVVGGVCCARCVVWCVIYGVCCWGSVLCAVCVVYVVCCLCCALLVLIVGSIEFCFCCCGVCCVAFVVWAGRVLDRRLRSMSIEKLRELDKGDDEFVSCVLFVLCGLFDVEVCCAVLLFLVYFCKGMEMERRLLSAQVAELVKSRDESAS